MFFYRKGAVFNEILGDFVVRSMNLRWDFDLYIATNTLDPRNLARDVYTVGAKAHWDFNGTGTIANVSPYAWTAGQNAGVHPPATGAWTIPGDEPEPQTTTGTIANDALHNETWSDY